MDTTSVSLLENLRRHDDQSSWAEFERLYRPWLRGVLSRAVAPGDVDDVVQEVVLTLLRELPGFAHNRQKGAFRRWLRRVAANRVREHWRTAARERPSADEVERRCRELADADDEQSRAIDREHDRFVVEQLLRRAANDFEPATLRAFRAFVLEGRSAAEAAALLGVSEAVVWTAKSRVLSRLRKMARDLVD